MIKRIAIIVLVLLNIGCDQISKDMVRDRVAPSEYIRIVEDYLILTNVENSGAMLGFGQGLAPIPKMILLQLLPTLVLLILLFRIVRKSNLTNGALVAFAFVIGGGIGNLIDRIAYGSVTDFFQIKMGFFKTGIFNMADVSVTLGVFMLLWLSLRPGKSLA